MVVMMQVADFEALRREIKVIAEKVNELRPSDNAAKDGEYEAMANVTLAFRHLEDASMRLGKAIQALNGGVSIYDKTQVPDSATGD